MGLGLATMLTSKGAKVVGCDMNEAQGQEKMKALVSSHERNDRDLKERQGAVFVKADVTNWQSIQNVFNTAVKEFGTVGKSV
jgi:NAD(P)-dependent dehydrogenase (short-subunit alcohol dehydrogenase family)